MKILHTSDWHFGAFLENRRFSRLPEQAVFVDELSDICDEENIDLIIVAGDVFDHAAPSAEAEKLYYDALFKLSKNKKRAVAVIAGNHDDPQRLTAANALLSKVGVMVIGLPYERAANFNGEHFKTVDLGGGVFSVTTAAGETAVIAALPYVGEKRLGRVIAQKNEEFDEEAFRKNYSDVIKSIYGEMAAFFSEDAINIAVGHLYSAGGETSFGAERDIARGGAFAVPPSAFPNADYIALGHLHRAQTAKKDAAYYSGSPLYYSLSEANAPRQVIVVDINKKSGKKEIRKAALKNLKVVEDLEFFSVEEALGYLEKNSFRDYYVYILLKLGRPLYNNEIEALYAAKDDIVSLTHEVESQIAEKSEAIKELSITEEFADFYRTLRGVEAPEDLLALFSECAEDD